MKSGKRMVVIFVFIGAVLMSAVSSAEVKGRASTEEITKVTLLAAEPQVARLVAGDLRAVAGGKKTKIEAAKCAETKGMDVAHPLPMRILLLKGALGLYASEGDLEGTKRVTSVLEELHCPQEIIDETVRKSDVRFLPGREAEVPKNGRYRHEEIHVVKAFGLNDAVLADTNRFPFAEKSRNGWSERIDLPHPFGIFTQASVHFQREGDKVLLSSIRLSEKLRETADERELCNVFSNTIAAVGKELGLALACPGLTDVKEEMARYQGRSFLRCNWIDSDVSVSLFGGADISVSLQEANYIRRGGRFLQIAPAVIEVDVRFRNDYEFASLGKLKRVAQKAERTVAFGPDYSGILSQKLKDAIGRSDKKGKESRDLERCKRAAAAGDVSEMIYLAWRYRYGHGVPSDPKMEFMYSRMAADCGSGRGLADLAVCYQEGRGCAKDLKVAAELFKKAALKDNEWAVCRYGQCLAEGSGVKKNPAAAVEWFKKGADGGSIWGMSQVAKYYLTGFGVKKDPSEARKWLSKMEKIAGDDSHYSIEAVRMLCELYLDGYQGTGRDPDRAFKYCQLAASSDFGWGIRMLGRCYEEGIGTAVDKKKARELYVRARKKYKDADKAAKELDALIKKLGE